jgi:hypothetical protein
MSNVVKFRTADEQCAEYVVKQRIKQRAQHADRALDLYLNSMHKEFGAEATLGALVRYVGSIMLDCSRSALLRVCRRYLTKCIVEGVLTRARIIH